ncbi:hypothetical protein HZC31_07200 [Candidatus Woesearchaeota archaeon]|nr:hypothetical protein [Candidatus Woesearchaeota archaeon]
MVGTYYEGSGATLDAALRCFKGEQPIERFDAPQFLVEIFRTGNDGERVASVTSGRSYDHVLGLAQHIADLNTRGAYTCGLSGYRTRVTVRGYYQ